MKKKHYFYNNWTISNVIIAGLIIVLAISLILNRYIIMKNGSVEENNKFTLSDWNYMLSIIEKDYGNGKKFVVVEKYTDKILKKVRRLCMNNYEVTCYENVYIGEKASIIGYFDNKDNGYFISFSRYISGSPYKSGNNVIINTYTQDNYLIEESDD